MAISKARGDLYAVNSSCLPYCDMAELVEPQKLQRASSFQTRGLAELAEPHRTKQGLEPGYIESARAVPSHRVEENIRYQRKIEIVLNKIANRPLRTRHRDSPLPHHVVYRETFLSISYVLASAVEPSRSRNLPWHWSQVSDFEDVCCRSTVCRDAVEAAYGVNFNGDEEKIVAHLFKLYAEKTAQA